MSQARCFNCEELMEGIGKSMEDFIEDKFPIFCSINCSGEFPINEEGIGKRIEKLKEKLK